MNHIHFWPRLMAAMLATCINLIGCGSKGKMDAEKFFAGHIDEIKRHCSENSILPLQGNFLKYALIDIDGDGIDELYVRDEGQSVGWFFSCGGNKLHFIEAENYELNFYRKDNVLVLSGSVGDGASYAAFHELNGSMETGPGFIQLYEYFLAEDSFKITYLGSDDKEFPAEQAEAYIDKLGEPEILNEGFEWKPFALLQTIGTNIATEEDQTDINAEDAKTDDEILSIAFLGYYDSFEEMAKTKRYKELCRLLPELRNISEVEAEFNGDCMFLVIPRDRNASVTVNTLYPNGEIMDIMYKGGNGMEDGNDGRPFLLLCSADKEYHNAQIEVVDNGGHSTSYRPLIDASNGNALLSTNKHVKDITPPLPKPITGMERNLCYSPAVDGGNCELGIIVNIEAGRPIVTLNKQKMAKQLPFLDKETYEHLDERLPVRNLNGICIGVYSGDIGQDINPVLCMVMDDGTMKTASLFFNIQEFYNMTWRFPGIQAGPKHPGINDIRSFRLYYPEEYVSIEAIDGNGDAHEVLTFVNHHIFYHETEELYKSLVLSPDWNITFVDVKGFEGAQTIYYGRFWEEIGIDDDGNATYGFEFSTINGDMGYQPANIGGRFRINTDTPHVLKFTPLEGFAFGGSPNLQVNYSTTRKE